MTTKADFNGEEWATVSAAPAIGGLIVATAQRGDTLRESLAIGKGYAEAAREHEGSELLGELATGATQPGPREFSSAEDLRLRGLERIREAAELVEAKATSEELEAYRRFAIGVAQRAAEAGKTGGVLGIGGERVTDAERLALAEVASALGTEPPAEPAG